MPTPFDLNGRRALLTGGTGALGLAMARGLQDAGCRVGVMSRSADKLELARTALTRPDVPEPLILQGDVLDRDSLESARETLVQTWGGLDILVNAAGGNRKGATISPEQTFFDLNLADFRAVGQLNLDGTVLPCLIFGQLLTEAGGSIVNISSMAADRTITRVLGYSAAKAGIDNFTRWLAVEMAQKFGARVRVNAIAPGFFVGEQNRHLLLQADGTPTERGRTIIRNTPMQRFAEAEELVTALLFLCAPGSSFVTGTVIPVDGGFSAFSGV